MLSKSKSPSNNVKSRFESKIPKKCFSFQFAGGTESGFREQKQVKGAESILIIFYRWQILLSLWNPQKWSLQTKPLSQTFNGLSLRVIQQKITKKISYLLKIVKSFWKYVSLCCWFQVSMFFQAARTMAVIVVTFIVCWLPFFTM